MPRYGQPDMPAKFSFSQPSAIYPEVRRIFKDRQTRIGLLVLLILGIVYSLSPSRYTVSAHAATTRWTPSLGSGSRPNGEVVDPLKPRSAVGKVHAVFGEPNPVYERALKLHEIHAEARGHPMHVLRERVLSGLWSKPAYILSVMLQELAKPEGQRLEWLL